MRNRAGYIERRWRCAGVLALAVATAATPLSADRLDHRYDSLGRLTMVCNAMTGDGERTDYTLDAADNRSRYKNSRTDYTFLPDTEEWSGNGQYRLRFEANGNLVLYRNSDNYPLWSTGTTGSGARVAYFQSDGNLVLYTQSGSVYASNTYMYPCANLNVEDDGYVRIRSSDGAVRWQKP